MREYKREAATAQEQLKDLTRRSAHHDDHLRSIDAWLSQLVEEVSISSAEGKEIYEPPSLPYDSTLLSANHAIFEKHLKDKSDRFKAAVSKILSKIPAVDPDTAALQARVSQLIAKEKSHILELQRLEAEQQQIQERLESASLRYIRAEKKIDRMKSSQVAKLEAQSIAKKPDAGGVDGAKIKREDSQQVNGVVSDEDLRNAEGARKEAEAVSEKRLEQLRKLELENKTVSEELTAARIKATKVSEEDFANADLFKSLKSQLEDLIKRANDLDATNIQLRAELKRLQAERSAYKEETDKEQTDFVQDMESQLARSEADLARIRHARDELLADLGLRKENDKQSRVAHEQLIELSAAKDLRISALESQLARLNHDESDSERTQLDSLDTEALRSKVRMADKEKDMLGRELQSMEVALKKTSAAATKKIVEIADAEERISKATAEKAKADQKYFAAMKAKETIQVEMRAQKAQNSKASEIVSQLKDAESSCRQLVATGEKELAEAKENLGKLTNQHRELQTNYTSQKSLIDRLTNQVEEMKKMLVDKDVKVQETNQARREADEAAAELRVRVDQMGKSLSIMREKSQGNQSEDYKILKASEEYRLQSADGII